MEWIAPGQKLAPGMQHESWVQRIDSMAGRIGGGQEENANAEYARVLYELNGGEGLPMGFADYMGNVARSNYLDAGFKPDETLQQSIKEYETSTNMNPRMIGAVDALVSQQPGSVKTYKNALRGVFAE